MSPSAAIPDYKKYMIDPIKLTNPAVHVQGVGGDLGSQAKALTTCLSDTASALAELTNVANDHADHFVTHYDGIA